MQAGEIYFWNTDRATGHDTRDKYHLYVCEGGAGYEDLHTFLFINKRDYGGDYAIHKTDYGFFSLDVSYVGGVVTYTADELKAASPVLKGRLSTAHLAGLCASVAGSETMTGYEQKHVYNALMAALR